MSTYAKRYQRNQQTFSAADQQALEASTVAVVGCGGLGGYIAEELARAGVGHLVLIDGDSLEETNLNRQLFATEELIGRPKVDAARIRLQAVNSEINVKTIGAWFEEETGQEFLRGADLVFDALDTASARRDLEKVCHALNIPLVFASIAGWFGLVGLSFPGEWVVQHLFGDFKRGIETVWGNPAFTPAVVASMAVAEGLKVLTGKPLALRQAWLQVDLLAMEFERFSF